MGTSLSGLTPKDTYPSLLKISDNTIINSTLKTISDGSGDDTVLQLSTLRVGIKSDSTVTTQTSSVIQSSTANASLVIAPNGTGALVADIPDGAATGGNARGANAVDLQMNRIVNTQVALGIYSVIAGGEQNTAAANLSTVVGGRGNTAGDTFAFVGGGASNAANTSYSTVSGGQSNTASTNTHATVVGGSGNTSSGQYAVSGGRNCVSSGNRSIAFNDGSQATGLGSAAFNSSVSSGSYSTSFGANGNSSAQYSLVMGIYANGYLYNGFYHGSSDNSTGNKQISNLIASREAALLASATTVLSLDGTGVTNLIIPNGSNRAWNVQVNWVAIVTAITGTATGITVGDTITQVQTLGFKRIGGTSSLIGTANTLSTNANPSMSTASMAYSAGGSQEMAITFTAPTFAGAGSITCRVVARIELTEVAF